METKKIAIACFIGGIICSLVALIFAPTYWWLGIIAGFASGYISYEFREVLKAAPIAFRAAKREVVILFSKTCEFTYKSFVNGLAGVRSWIVRPRPFSYTSAVLAIFLVHGYLYFHHPAFIIDGGAMGYTHPTHLMIVAIFCLGVGWAVSVVLALIAMLGGLKNPFNNNYGDVYRTIGKGLRRIIVFLLLWWWLGSILMAVAICCLIGKFCYKLFFLIHSQKRVLCAVDGTIGGALSYLLLHSSTPTLASSVTIIIFGGLIGAALGVANWEIVSKRILHVTVEES